MRSVLERGESRNLRAVNHHSRLIWGKAISRQLSDRFCPAGSVDHSEAVFFITLVHAGCATSASTTAPDIQTFKSQLRRGLSGLSYFGAIEPAYYTNVQKGANVRLRKCIFWHMHALVWGISAPAMRRLVEKLNTSECYRAIAPGLDGAHSIRVKRGDLPRVAGYIFKPPANAYRVSRVVSSYRGLPTYRFIHGKSRLRPGERVRLFLAMRALYLDNDLTVTGGEGRKLLAGARAEALQSF